MGDGNQTPEQLLELAKSEFASGDPQMRGQGLQRLLTIARLHETVREEALPIFRQALASEETPWAAANAARGIALIAGADEGRQAWLSLLEHRHVEIAAASASLVDVSLAPALLEALEKRTGLAIQISFARALGRLKHAPAFDAIVRRLADPEVRPHAIVALGDLGEARAVPHLKAFLNDRTEAWEEDNHGPMMRVRDLAGAAIAKLGGAPTPSAPLSPTARVTPAQTMAPAAKRVTKTAPANAWAYVPLVAGLVSVPWFGIVVFAVLYSTGTFKPTPEGARTLDLIALAPGAVGLFAGSVALLRGGPRDSAETLCLIAGAILCGLFVFSFGFEYFFPDVP